MKRNVAARTGMMGKHEWSQISWCLDDDEGYFDPYKALNPPRRLGPIEPTGMEMGFAFTESRPEERLNPPKKDRGGDDNPLYRPGQYGLPMYLGDYVAASELSATLMQVLKKVPTRTGPCCTPSTISCHSYGLASHQVLHDLALSCTITHNKIVKYGSFTQILIPCNNQLPSTIAPIQIIHTEGVQGCLRSRADTQQLLSTRRSSQGAHGDTGVGHVHKPAPIE